MNTININVAGKPVELRFTMYRAKLLQELTGVDILNDREGIRKAAKSMNGAVGVLFALAGGERKTGMELDDFADELTFTDMRELGEKINAVMARDAAPAEGGEAGGAPNSERATPAQANE